MRFSLGLAIVMLSFSIGRGAPALDTAPSLKEREDISRRLTRFYQWPPKSWVMDEGIKKFNALDEEIVFPNRRLRIPGLAVSDPLLRQAQAKAKESYRRERCTKFLKKKFPDLKCEVPNGLETAQAHDKIEDLAHTWLRPNEVEYSLDRLPIQGTIDRPYWSGDYWAMRLGLTSYRYGEGKYYSDYREAVAAYDQPKEWEALLTPFDPEKIALAILRWSPAEKYDLVSGAETFPLANEQKREGEAFVGDDGTVEGWFGICHGWAPAAVFVDPPVRPVMSTGARSVKVAWYPDDIRALVTLAWANGWFATNFVGGRCNAKEIERYENGRVKQPECFDNNPATFHQALGNLIGKKRVPFIMDASFDHQVWNQPVLGYEFEYFNPLDVEKRSPRWETVAVPYDRAFKERDRFQKPNTRGVRLGEGRYDDSGVRKIVGVVATVSYLVEVGARFSETAAEPSVVRATYLYDLELHEKSGELAALGGEWHSNTHPDFLWVPEKGVAPHSSYEEGLSPLALDEAPTEVLAKRAAGASREGYPLCQVLAPLVEASAETGAKYPCRAGE